MTILFGVRSPIVVEYEETCHRLGLHISAAVSLKHRPRLLDRSKQVHISDFKEFNEDFYTCAFLPNTREAYFQHAVSLGLSPAEALIDPHAIVARSTKVGNASFLNAGVIVGAVTSIGIGVLINRGVTIGHHCMLGDFVSIGPGANLASNIQVGDKVVIGAGATILPGIKLGENCVIAGGSLVNRDVQSGEFAAGSPAKSRPFDKNNSSLYIKGEE